MIVALILEEELGSLFPRWRLAMHTPLMSCEPISAIDTGRDLSCLATVHGVGLKYGIEVSSSR